LYSQNADSNPLPYQWPTTASTDAYQTIICLCTPVHHLAQISDPTTRNVQITLRTALSPDKNYLGEWISHDKQDSIAAVFNASCDLMNATRNSMDRQAMRQFLRLWITKRDQFIFSLTGDSKSVPPFVCLDLIASVWDEGDDSVQSDDEKGSDEQGRDDAETGTLWEDGLTGKLTM
jgi:hypothetical protein